jgi:integrase
MDESRVRKVFKRALKQAKLPECRLYDLRHTYASLLLAERSNHMRGCAARPLRRRRSGRVDWWAVKDSNLGPAELRGRGLCVRRCMTR